MEPPRLTQQFVLTLLPEHAVCLDHFSLPFGSVKEWCYVRWAGATPRTWGIEKAVRGLSLPHGEPARPTRAAASGSSDSASPGSTASPYAAKQSSSSGARSGSIVGAGRLPTPRRCCHSAALPSMTSAQGPPIARARVFRQPTLRQSTSWHAAPIRPASLSGETGGDLARSPRWDEVMRPVGIGDIATVACRDGLGCWGWIEAYRDGADRPFGVQDLSSSGSVGPRLGSALRRSVMYRDATATSPSRARRG